MLKYAAAVIMTAVYWFCMARFWKQKGWKGCVCEKLLEASPLSHRTNAAGFKMDLPQAKAEPISDDGTHWVNKVRKEKKLLGRSNCSW